MSGVSVIVIRRILGVSFCLVILLFTDHLISCIYLKSHFYHAAAFNVVVFVMNKSETETTDTDRGR